jgi:hypothetical protein
MRVSFAILSLVAFCTLLAGSCGEDESVCEKADDVRATAFNEVCVAKGDECCICKCWNDGQQEIDTLDPCTCKAQPSGCSGELKTGAKNCLDNPEQCRQDVKDRIELACPTPP